MEELSESIEEKGGRHYAPAGTGDGDHSARPRAAKATGYKVLLNSQREWDPGIIMRESYEEDILVTKCADHWLSVALRASGEVITLFNMHLPKMWHQAGYNWHVEVADMPWLREVRGRRGQHTVIMGGRHESGPRQLASKRTVVMAEWAEALRLRGAGAPLPTHRWTHPGPGELLHRRLDSFWTSEGPWQASLLGAPVLRDHEPEVL